MKVGKDVYWIGVRHPARRKFKHIIRCEYGTTYNSYVIVDGVNVVIDGVPKKFEKLWMKRLEEVCSHVDYVLLTHASPHKSESLEMLLRRFPEVTVLGTETTIDYLGDLLEVEFSAKVVKDGDIINLNDKELVIMEMPYWPWPGSMMIYAPHESSLFSAGGFSSHYCEEAILYSEVAYPKKYKDSLRKYFRYTLLPYRKYLKVGLNKIGAKYISKVYPSYGPIIDVDVDKIIELYESWIVPEHKAVVVAYVSVYGYTEKMARAIASGIEKMGLDVILLDLDENSRKEVLEAISVSKGIIIGTPTIYETVPVKILSVLSVLPYVPDWRDKRIGIFGCETYSTVGVDILESILKSMGARYVFGTIKASLKPTREDLEKCVEFGKAFAAVV